MEKKSFSPTDMALKFKTPGIRPKETQRRVILNRRNSFAS